MKISCFYFYFVVLFFVTQELSAQYITVDDNYTAQQLIENVLVNSPCANVSNFSVQGWTFQEGEKSYGYFTRGSSTFPFENGVLITTGRAVSAIGPNTSLLSEGAVNWGGDADLEAAIGENNTINATVLEFDFLPLANKVTFEYVFSSEQYLSNPNPNQCNFSDGFAFLLREVDSQDQYENLAIVPGTTIPVKITTVRGTGTLCPPANEQYFDAFNGTEHPTNYNGQTKILKAEAIVTPGVLYHMKLVVADQGNHLYDSAIFLGGGSFRVTIDLGEDKLIANGNPLCEGDTWVLDGEQEGNNTYQWYLNEEPIIGAVNPQYEVSSEGHYKVEVELGNSGCIAEGSVLVEYKTLPEASQGSLVACADSDGKGYFNLTSLNTVITNEDAGLSVTYFETIQDAENIQNSITTLLSYYSEPATIYARVTDNFSCASIVEVNLEVTDTVLNTVQYTTCDNDGVSDGVTMIDISGELTDIVIAPFPSGYTLAFYGSQQDALMQQDELPGEYTNTQPYQQTIWGRVNHHQTGCYALVQIVLNVVTLPGNNNQVQTKVLCTGSMLNLVAPSGFQFYEWSTGETQQILQVNTPGLYTVEAISQHGCIAVFHYEVIQSDPPNILTVDSNDFSGNQNSITIFTQGTGNYIYSINGVNFQYSPVFSGLSSGLYTITVQDIDGCGSDSVIIYLLDYPRFFSPNGDGVNDYWYIRNLPGQAVVHIFDRYGKIVGAFRGTDIGWDGRFNNTPLPATDYWFIVQLGNGREVKGHFSLIR